MPHKPRTRTPPRAGYLATPELRYQRAVLPNWFLAFPVAAEWITELPKLPPRFRRFDASDVHLTLVFLGSCGETAAHAALDTVRAGLRDAHSAPITITLSNVVPMGPKREYTALSALLDVGRDAVTDLMRKHRDAPADAAGIRRDQRSPIPHITLGRPQRRATDADRAAGLDWAAAVSLPQTDIVLDRVALYTWNSDRAESLFRIVDSTRLDGGP